MADQAKGKGIAPKKASNLADPGQSSRPPPPIRTLLEDEEDGEDYSEVIEVLKQYIKSHERVIASQSSDIKTLLLSLNTLKASVKDSVSAIKNISSTLASLTNSSNAAATGKTSYSPRFDPFSGTMDLDSPLRPPRKEPHLGPAIDNTATSNLDPPIDTGSKEGFKDTITSSIVKELSKKAYTIPDDSKLSGESNFEQWIQALKSKKEDVYNEFHALTFSTYKKGLSAFNAEFNGYFAKLAMAKIDIDPSLILNQYFKALESKFPSWVSRQKSSIRQARMLGLIASSLNIEYLMADILEESRNPAIEAYRAAYIANSSNSTPNSNSNPSKKGKNKKKAIEEEEEESDSSSNSRYKKRKDFKGKGLKTSSNNKAKYKDNKPRRRPRDPALYNSWLYDTGSTDHISNSKERFTTFTPNTGQLRPINTGNSPVSPAGIGSITLKVLSRKAPPTYTKLVLDNVLYLPNIDINIVSRVRYYDSGGCLIKETLYGGDRRCIAILDFKKSGFFLDVRGSSKPILHANFAFPLGLTSYNTTKSIEPQRNKIVVEIPSNSIRKEDYRPIIEDTIVSEAIEPNKRYKLRNSLAKGTTLEGVGPSLRGKRPCRPVEPLATAQAPYQSPRETREPEPLTGTRDLPCVLREPVIEGNKVVEKAISSPTLKEPNIGQRDYYNLLNLAKLWHVGLGHIGLRLLKKTSSITKGLPNFDKIKEADFHCSSCDRGKAVRRVNDCLFIGPHKGYITDLKKRLNKVYAIEDLGPAAYFLGWLSRSLNRPTKLHLNAAKNLFKYLNSTKDYSICFSYNVNTVADLGPKLSNSSYTTTKLSRDFHSKEGPRPLTTTSTPIVDSRNSKGSSRTSIINSSLVPIGFSDSDFAGDKATSKSTYGYLYKLAGGPISWKTKRATTIALSTLEAETDGLTEAIREVQTKHTLLKFRYVREQVKAKIVTIIYLNTKYYLNDNIEIEDCQTTITTSTTAKETAIDAITIVPIVPSSSTPPTINAPTISAHLLTNVFTPFLRGLNGTDPGQSSRPPPPIRTLLEDKEDGEDCGKVIEVLKHVSTIKNISSTLASLTNSSNTAATRKTSYRPAIDNTATSNLDPSIDTGSKEGFKDTITSSIVKELSKKAYTILDDKNPNISNTYSDSDQAVLLMLLRDSLSSSPRAAIS
ncbi:hypothetical protein P8C59_007667 [Phyllachora maydis]|uniref:Retrovirus-related Pol polyprotein from transposon TNT 1-94-like beta-barrel domain-containing protein n=1 Tax=Phyllachora maydis TaxID=1825666 RepID=A0AAD9MDS7_9PEZI|nr:hypothetical protein P8C59_007667 [Phyllachora maydis]